VTQEPKNYREWIKLLQSHGARFETYEKLPLESPDFRVILRHDIDLFDMTLLDKCKNLELDMGVTSTWLFLPPGDKRYRGVKKSDLARYLVELQSEGFEIGYHINAWEVPGTYELTNAPLTRLDNDLAWFKEVLGVPVKVALAHGIPRHKQVVSNFSMFDALAARGIAMLDSFIIHDGGEGRRIPHFGYRAPNPRLSGLRIIYTSDSGGPVRREWESLDRCFGPGQTFILGMHCGNYDVTRDLTYGARDPSRT
jgi:hypothetical protein